MKTTEEIEKLAAQSIDSEQGQVGFVAGYNACLKDLNEKTDKQEEVMAIVADFTSFNSRGEKVFFGRTEEQTLMEIKDSCDTAVIHKLTVYRLKIAEKSEKKIDKPIEITSKHEENLLSLLKARRHILSVSKSVINERVSKKLVKRSDDLDDILVNDKLD